MKISYEDYDPKKLRQIGRQLCQTGEQIIALSEAMVEAEIESLRLNFAHGLNEGVKRTNMFAAGGWTAYHEYVTTGKQAEAPKPKKKAAKRTRRKRSG